MRIHLHLDMELQLVQVNLRSLLEQHDELLVMRFATEKLSVC